MIGEILSTIVKTTMTLRRLLGNSRAGKKQTIKNITTFRIHSLTLYS